MKGEKEPMAKHYEEHKDTLKITRAVARMINLMSENHAPRETGGLVFGRGGLVSQVVILPNKELMYPRTLYKPDDQKFMDRIVDMERRGFEWMGWWHSHPHISASPSSIDFRNHRHSVPMIIYSTTTCGLRAYHWENPQEMNYLQELPVVVEDE